MAHGNWQILHTLLELLDDPRNDVFLHVDKRAEPPSEIVQYRPEWSTFNIIPPKEVFWADFSQVQVTLDLLRQATVQGFHAYYHLLSGVDLPIKTMDHIHEYFAEQTTQFVGIVPHEVWYSVRRVKYYHPFTKCQRYRGSTLLKGGDRLLEYLQRGLGVNRLKPHADLAIYDGWQWFSITHAAAEFTLSQAPFIERLFTRTIAPDELFMQTIIMNSQYREKLHDPTNLSLGSMRHIDWVRGRPYTFRKEDLGELSSSPCMFARKFDERVDLSVVQELQAIVGKSRYER